MTDEAEDTHAAAAEAAPEHSPDPVASAQEEHPVTKAVKEHLSEKIGEALAEIPASIEKDFAAVVAWVKAAI